MNITQDKKLNIHNQHKRDMKDQHLMKGTAKKITYTRDNKS